MAHQHNVYDTDKHFVIDPNTRKIENQSKSKITLIQNDHDSERFTFEIQRYVEEHDMSICNKVEVHYINIDGATKETNPGVYEVEDLQVSPDSEDVVICSWLISRNATKYIGTLHFALRFACLTDEVVDYDWRTGIYSEFPISETIFNTDAVVEEYADILADWEARITALEEGGGADLSQYALKTDIPEVPTNVSAFVNDAGYLTEHQDLSSYALKTDIPEVPENVSAFINDAGYLTELPEIATSWNDLEDKPFGESSTEQLLIDSAQVSGESEEITTNEYEPSGNFAYEILKDVSTSGNPVRIVFDGVSYDFPDGFEVTDEVVEGVTTCYIGNKSLVSDRFSESDNGIPFAIRVMYFQVYMWCASNETHEMSIYQHLVSIEPLDPKYLPDTVAMKTDIPTVPTNVSSFTNDSGYQTADQVNALINTALGVIENGTY